MIKWCLDPYTSIAVNFYVHVRGPLISFQTPEILGTFCDAPDNKVTICYIVWLPIALPGFCITCRNLHSSVFFFPRGFSLSCAQCNAYLLYCARNKRPARGQGWSTYIFEAIVSQAHFAICLRENILWYRSMFPLRSSAVGNILNYVAIMWVYLANRWLALDEAIQYLLMPWLHLHVKAHPVRATQDNFYENEWGLSISWQLQGLPVCHKDYVAVTGSTFRSFSWKSPCEALTGQIYVKVWPWHDSNVYIFFR